jgi:hypothetical protein
MRVHGRAPACSCFRPGPPGAFTRPSRSPSKLFFYGAFVWSRRAPGASKQWFRRGAVNKDAVLGDVDRALRCENPRAFPSAKASLYGAFVRARGALVAQHGGFRPGQPTSSTSSCSTLCALGPPRAWRPSASGTPASGAPRRIIRKMAHTKLSILVLVRPCCACTNFANLHEFHDELAGEKWSGDPFSCRPLHFTRRTDPPMEKRVACRENVPRVRTYRDRSLEKD